MLENLFSPVPKTYLRNTQTDNRSVITLEYGCNQVKSASDMSWDAYGAMFGSSHSWRTEHMFQWIINFCTVFFFGSMFGTHVGT